MSWKAEAEASIILGLALILQVLISPLRVLHRHSGTTTCGSAKKDSTEILAARCNRVNQVPADSLRVILIASSRLRRISG
jgi:hypothetical protein